MSLLRLTTSYNSNYVSFRLFPSRLFLSYLSLAYLFLSHLLPYSRASRACLLHRYLRSPLPQIPVALDIVDTQIQ